MRILLSFCMICAALQARAQQYQAQLTDKTDGRPVAYANIGIAGTNVGTNSDENGKFSIAIGPELAGNMVQISMIGYQDYNINVAEFEKEISRNSGKILLQKSVIPLKEVMVRPAKLITAKLGNSVSCGSGGNGDALPFPYLVNTKKDGKKLTDTLTEIGTLMKVKHKKAFIDSVQINIGSCSYEHVFFRLNVYEEVDGDFKNILQEPIYIDLDRDKVGNTIRINLTDKNLVTNSDFIISMEKVKELGDGELTMCAKMLGAPMYMRVASHHEKFVKLPIVGFGIAAFVTFSEKQD